MKWQHWLFWGLLASLAIVLGIVVFQDKPAEAQGCTPQVYNSRFGVAVHIPCPNFSEDMDVIGIRVTTPNAKWIGYAEK